MRRADYVLSVNLFCQEKKEKRVDSAEFIGYISANGMPCRMGPILD